MKTIVTLLTIFALSYPSTWAQSNQYKQAMSQAIATMHAPTAQATTAAIVATANQFERIASAEPNEWLPRYYAGLNYVYLGFTGKDQAAKDKYLDQADANLKAAESVVALSKSPENDELAVLRAYIAQARLVVDPMNRWQQYGPLAQAALAKAKRLNDSNPRPYVLEGVSLMNTPAQFGGGADVACPILKQAAQKFATFKPASDLAPMWGLSQIEPLLIKCQE